MMAAAKLILWIVQLCVILCVIRAQEQPMLGGTRRSLNSEKEDFKDAKLNGNSEAEVGESPKVLQGSYTGNSFASNMGIPSADQNMVVQVVQTPGQAGFAQPAAGYINEAYQAPLQQQQESQAGCDNMPNAYAEADESEQRRQDLRNLVQHLYVAQARVQLEATEIKKAQAVASSAQAQLEDSANQVRTVTATLHTAQQEVAASAIRAQIAQLQLAAHDQLLFAARQDVDALSSQMVGLQAAEGIVQPKLTVDLHALLDKLKQPLQQNDHPTPVPTIVGSLPGMASYQPQQFQVQPQPQGQAQGQGRGRGQGQVGAIDLAPEEKSLPYLEQT